MSRLTQTPRIELDVQIKLSLVEIQALDALAGYGVEPFLEVFYEQSSSLGYVHWSEPAGLTGTAAAKSSSLGYVHWSELVKSHHGQRLGV